MALLVTGGEAEIHLEPLPGLMFHRATWLIGTQGKQAPLTKITVGYAYLLWIVAAAWTAAWRWTRWRASRGRSVATQLSLE